MSSICINEQVRSHILANGPIVNGDLLEATNSLDIIENTREQSHLNVSSVRDALDEVIILLCI
jgi:hypothetical protein